MKKRLISIITMCLVGAILAGCAQGEIPLQTTEVTRGDLIISVSAKEGNLEMRHKEYLSFGTMGEVDEIMVGKGDKVTKGQVLAQLDISPLELKVKMAQAGWEMAQANYEMAENNLMRTVYPHYTNTYATDLPGLWRALEEIQNNLEEAQELLEQGEIEGTKALLELVEENTSKAERKSQARRWALPFTVKLAELQADEAEAALDMAKLELAMVELELAKATIIAPFDGIIADVYIDEGQQLSAMTYSSPAIYLVDPSNIEMSGEIDEIDISRVKLGQEAIIVLDALPDKTVEGKVTFISPTGKVWEDEVSYKITVTLENPDEELKDGMSASTEVITNRRDNVLLIPNRAIQGSLENPWVEVVTDDEAEKRQVTLGLSDGIYTEVLSGLKEGEEVVLR
jgi:RND family efflux transporter MFP subunit